MTSILFKNSNYHRHPSFGHMLEILLSCYFRGLELKYDTIYIEWPDIRFLWNDEGYAIGGFRVPDSKGLPFNIVGHDEIIKTDTSIDFGMPNCLYEGCEPIVSQTGCNIKVCQEYIKKYIKNNGNTPKFELIDYNSKFDRPFVLIHYREAIKENQKFRNLDYRIYIKLIKYIRRNYNIDIYKIGEPSPFDFLCDRVYEYLIEDISELFKLAYSCELYIGTPSGPCVISLFTGKSMILMVNEEVYEMELEGLGGILRNNQKIIITNRDNYKIVEDVIDEYLKNE